MADGKYLRTSTKVLGDLNRRLESNKQHFCVLPLSAALPLSASHTSFTTINGRGHTDTQPASEIDRKEWLIVCSPNRTYAEFEFVVECHNVTQAFGE